MNSTVSVYDMLKALQHKRGDNSPFKTHGEFLAWRDQVAPLLSFDKKLQGEFSSSALTVDIRTHAPDIEYDVDGVNECIGILNQAVLTYEILEASKAAMDKRQTQELKLEPPAKVTLKWLFEHAPLSAYASLCGALAAAFGAGAWFNDFRTTIQSRPLSIAPPTIENPTKASAPLTTSNAASNVMAAPLSSAASK